LRVTAPQVPDDRLPEIPPQEAVALLKSVFVILLEGLEVILYASDDWSLEVRNFQPCMEMVIMAARACGVS